MPEGRRPRAASAEIARIPRTGNTAAAAATWDRHAARYGAQEGLELRAVDVALRLAAPLEHERLVDLATGTGLVLRRLARHRRPPGEAIGVDASAAMLAAGTGAATIPSGWSLLEADARAVPLPGGCADVVTCAHLLQLLDARERAAVLAEALRLLAPRPQSRLVVVTPWSPRRAVRAGFALLAHTAPRSYGGLLPLDPSADIAAAGLRITRRIVVPRGGYPSLVVAAKPPCRTC